MSVQQINSFVKLIILSLLYLLPPAMAEELSPARIAAPLPSLLKSFKQNPKAEAEIILRSTLIEIDQHYFSHATSYVAVYINSDEAVRDYSQISISFNSFYEDIALEFAHVRTPEGETDSIKADATQIQSPTDENFYHDRKELLFSLPNVRKGSVIEFQYRYTDTRKIIPEQWFDSFSLNWWEDRAAGQGSRADPVANTEFTIKAPRDMQFYSNDLSNFAVTHTRQQKDTWQTLSWKGKNLPQIILQDNMPRDHSQTAQVRVSTMASWNQVANWSNGLIAPHLVSDAALDKLSSEIAKSSGTADEKVKAVYQLLQQKVRYVFAHAGRGGYEPHDAFEVLRNGYGDCKDQTTLAVTLLRKLGIKADPALVVTRSRGTPDMKITSVNFDHMIVHIPAQPGLQETWMDTSGDISLFPGFSLGLEGQPALIVNSNTADIVQIKSLPPEQHFAHLDIVFDKVVDKSLEANFSMQFGGMFEQRLRNLWQYSRERDKSFREMMGHIYPTADISELQGNNADNMWQGFNITGRFSAKSYFGDKEKLNYAFNITQLISLFVDLRNLHKPQDRVQDYANDPGYTLSTRVQFKQPAAEYIATVNSQGQNIDTPYFSLEQKGYEEKGNYIIEQKILFKPSLIAVKNYAQFYARAQQLLETSDWVVSYGYDKTAAELEKLNRNAAADGKAQSFIALAKLHIRKGAYDKALNAASQAVKNEPQNAEAYYVLGLAQGYSNRLYESEKSFARAEELGFAL